MYRFLSLLFIVFPISLQAQVDLQRQRPFMHIPDVIAMETSGLHVYVLSASEGLVVFRAHADSLQWQYTSTGMEKRGNKLSADARFAYLFGDQLRLSIVEPTSLLGVYSSTVLPGEPIAVHRIGNFLYVAMLEEGLARISLITPESVDESYEPVELQGVTSGKLNDLAGTASSLFVLSNQQQLSIFNDGADSLTLDKRITIDKPITGIYLFGEELFGVSANGIVYKIASDGRTRELARFNSTVVKLDKWHTHLVARTSNGRLHLIPDQGKSQVVAEVPGAGNHFVVSKQRLFTNEFEKISELQQVQNKVQQTALPKLRIKPIPNQIITFPRPLLLAIDTDPEFPAIDVQFHARAQSPNVQVRGFGLLWQPTAQEIGAHVISVIGTSSDGQVDSTLFSVDVRPFNAPPRFFPLRPVSIVVDEAYSVTLSAIDPDGPNRDLIRYVGIDLPEGAQLNEKTGEFRWKPDRKAVGQHKFQVIATDQFGAAAAQQVSITVLEASRGQ